jgi:excisionase family DNA binding protein
MFDSNTEPATAVSRAGRLDRLALNRQEIAELLGVSPSTVTRMVEAREIPHVRLRGSLRFPRQQLELWLGELAEDDRALGY